MDKESIRLQLEPQTIASCTQIPPQLSFNKNWLQHQVDVFQQSVNGDIILDLSPTGTGKTQAGASVLLHNPRRNAIYIAPTNALITQQAIALEKFVLEAGLPHVVKSASAKEIKQWSDDRVGKRSGEKLYNVLRNPATIFPEVGASRPILLVTNPDIFYYATFFAYNHLDKSNIASAFYSKFSTVIFDEFHLYDAKQLVGLFFYLALSHTFGYFQNNRKVILLTATPEPACEAALERLKQQGVRIVTINGESNYGDRLPSQTAVNLEILPQRDRNEWLDEICLRVSQYLQDNPDKNGAVILDSKDYINRLADLLKARGLSTYFGRITGSTPLQDRHQAAQKQVILATSTVDVGFNFEKDNPPTRQNLDWLIFSCRDRFSFWQRLGRVGRVLGKAETNIPSEAIAYLPDEAWEQGIDAIDALANRQTLKHKLEEITALDRPFLEVYWRSEAFLEIAKPLLEIEESLDGLDSQKYIEKLYLSLQSILGGKRDWNSYRYRMKVLNGAEAIVKTPVNKLKSQWKYIKGGQAFVKNIVKYEYPEDWEDLKAGKITIEQCEELFQNDMDAARRLKELAEIYATSYAPLFKFRDSLFDSLQLSDPKQLLLDNAGETILDPIHLLRNYEFVQEGKLIEAIARADEPYQLTFRMPYLGENDQFKNQEINKLNAFANCKITRKKGNAIAPTPLIAELDKKLIPGVIVSTAANQGIIIYLRKQGIISYPISVVCQDREKEYTFFPSLSGILAIATSGIRLRLPDNEDFYLA